VEGSEEGKKEKAIGAFAPETGDDHQNLPSLFWFV
tara:strand:- start:2342 stop:2446 length:105 start_codon:yes stop_codon:yes gene_type:complete